MKTFLKKLRTRITTTTISLRTWLALKLIHRGVGLNVEVRHGAHRSRSWVIWNGGLVHAEIPVNTKPAGTSSPLGYIAPASEQEIIDAATASGEWDPFPGKKAERGKACPFCGHTEWQE